MITVFKSTQISSVLLLSVLSVFVSINHDSLAMEDLPEFESLTEEESVGFEGPDQIGPEYQSDILSYMKPELWQYHWISSSKIFDSSVGSLSATQFLMDTRLKIHSKLTDNIEFRFTAFDDRDFEKQSKQQIFEFLTWANPHWGLSLYGSPDFSKRKNDTGIALVLKLASRHEVRVFNTFVDVTRLKRSDSTDKFIEPDLPYSRGLVGRLWSDPEKQTNNFLQYALRQETKTKWLFPEGKYIYSYQKEFVSVYLSHLFKPNLRISFRSQYDQKKEGREPSELASTVAQEKWTTQRFISYLRLQFLNIGPNDQWELSTGAMAALRWWDINERTAATKDFLPMLWLTFPGITSSTRQDRWYFGLIETLRSSTEGDASELRLSLGYDFHFSAQSTLRVQANADLDEYGTPRAWEGGNAQLSLKF